MTKVWTPGGNLVVAIEPVPGDIFVLITVHGDRVALYPIRQYAFALRAAEDLATKTTQPIKVLCMSLPELMRYAGAFDTRRTASVSLQDWEDFRQIVDVCVETLQRSSEAKVRRQARRLLIDMGAINR